MGRSRDVLDLALAQGFDLAALVPLGRPRHGERFEAWLAAGAHASMDWLESFRERILDPRASDPAARTLLVVALAHHRAAVELAGGGRVARYAAGRDYHNFMTKRLRGLARALRSHGLVDSGRIVVDAGPLLERAHAEEAGIGFASKAANLLHPTFGPWFFLGELFLLDELEPSPAPSPALGSCGTCTACLDACPTDAIPEPGWVDARRCISYLTIEHRGAIPHELRPLLGEWAFGCDVCSEVCPWGRGAPDLAERFGTHPFVEEKELVDWLDPAAPEPSGSALRRPHREGRARNAAHVLGNLPTESGRAALERTLERDPSALVRSAAFDGLLRGHGEEAGVPERLDRAVAREPERAARADMTTSRERFG